MVKTNGQLRQRLVNFKLTEDEYQRLKELAGEYTDGHLSVWIRHRVLNPPEYKNAGSTQNSVLCGSQGDEPRE